MSSNRITIFGDYMLDIFIQACGKKEININGCIPSFLIKRYEYMPGGAGTVARLLISAKLSVNCVGLIGDDWAGRLLHNMLTNNNKQKYLFKEEHIDTRIRLYIIDAKGPFIRLDIEGPNKNVTSELIGENMKKVKINTDILAILDFNKGCGDCSNMKVKSSRYMVASIKHRGIRNYLKADILVINVEEHIENKKDITKKDIVSVTNNIRGQGYLGELIVTCGSFGLYYESFDGKLYHFPSKAKCVKNTIGCGDTFVAELLLGLNSKESILDSVSRGVYYSGLAAEYQGIALPILPN